MQKRVACKLRRTLLQKGESQKFPLWGKQSPPHRTNTVFFPMYFASTFFWLFLFGQNSKSFRLYPPRFCPRDFPILAGKIASVFLKKSTFWLDFPLGPSCLLRRPFPAQMPCSPEGEASHTRKNGGGVHFCIALQNFLCLRGVGLKTTGSAVGA